MRIAATASALAADLTALGELGDAATQETARRLAQAMTTPMAARLVELVSELAAELDATLTTGRAEVRLTGDDARIDVVVDDGATSATPLPSDEPTGDDTDARITLRLPARLKAGLETAAAAEGISLNAHIVRQLGRSQPASGRRAVAGRRRLSGTGHS